MSTFEGHNAAQPRRRAAPLALRLECKPYAATLSSCLPSWSRSEARWSALLVRVLKYFGNQPWPFGRSLMIGFSATYAGGSLTPDGHEIVEADWFSRDQLPDLPPKVSIARRLIDAFVERSTPRS
ncbi:hypothetical protein WMF41_09925 [Sorangium sp. So ce1151]